MRRPSQWPEHPTYGFPPNPASGVRTPPSSLATIALVASEGASTPPRRYSKAGGSEYCLAGRKLSSAPRSG